MHVPAFVQHPKMTKDERAEAGKRGLGADQLTFRHFMTLPDTFLDHLEQQVVLAGEVVEDAACRNSDAGRDVAHGRAVETVFEEDPRRDVQDLIPATRACHPFLAGAGHPGRQCAAARAAVPRCCDH